jgi:hypothetical protein
LHEKLPQVKDTELLKCKTTEENCPSIQLPKRKSRHTEKRQYSSAAPQLCHPPVRRGTDIQYIQAVFGHNSL